MMVKCLNNLGVEWKFKKFINCYLILENKVKEIFRKMME